MSTSALIADVRQQLAGAPVFLTGSLVAADVYGKHGYHDVDLFTPTQEALVSVCQRLIDQGYTFGDRFQRTYERWLEMGMGRWHTNSMRLYSPSGVETNIVFKKADGHPTTSLAQVLESFDFGLLAMGYDLRLDVGLQDMRGYLFPGMDPNGPLPMLPVKQAKWVRGLISQYNGLRECGRYAKYHRYGYDLSLVKPDLVKGYYELASYHAGHPDFQKQKFAAIYENIAIKIEDDAIDELLLANKKLLSTDSFDAIMEALE